MAKQLPVTLQNLDDYIGKDQPGIKYCIGHMVTCVDYILTNYLDWVRAFSPSTLLQYPTLCKIKQRVESRTNLKTYLESSRRPATITVSLASYGGTPETS